MGFTSVKSKRKVEEEIEIQITHNIMPTAVILENNKKTLTNRFLIDLLLFIFNYLLQFFPLFSLSLCIVFCL